MIQIVVTYKDHQTMYFPVKKGWRVDSAARQIVVGQGVPRQHIPLDNVLYYAVESVSENAPVLNEEDLKPDPKLSTP